MRTIRRGSRGADVRRAQKALNAHGFGPLEVDGIFGRGTAAAVVQFQQSLNLTADAIVGPATWSALLTGPAAKLTLADPLAGKRAELRELAKEAEPEAVRRALLGAVEDLGKAESPNGSNTGPEIAHLVGGYGDFWKIINPKTFPWCAIAACAWTARGLGLGRTASKVDWAKHPFGAWLGGVAQIQEWAEKNGRMEYHPLPGHLFVMPRAGSSSDPNRSTRAGHCGLVVGVLEGHKVVTIEGNVSNRVGSHIRPQTALSGFVRWWE